MFESYISQLTEEQRTPFSKIIQLLENNLPKGFEAQTQYSMPSFVVPHSIFPAGYHCNPKEPLPFISVASQKNFIALYHMGMYAKPELLQWFTEAYPKHCKYKLDMGKSCIRFKKLEDIPYNLLGDLFQKMSIDEWIKIYQEAFMK